MGKSPSPTRLVARFSNNPSEIHFRTEHRHMSAQKHWHRTIASNGAFHRWKKRQGTEDGLRVGGWKLWLFGVNLCSSCRTLNASQAVHIMFHSIYPSIHSSICKMQYVASLHNSQQMNHYFAKSTIRVYIYISVYNSCTQINGLKLAFCYASCKNYFQGTALRWNWVSSTNWAHPIYFF